MKTLTCPECGVSFKADHHHTVFCSPAHRTRFHRVMEKRGQVLSPFAQVSRKVKSGFIDTRKYALRQYNRLVDAFNAEDKACGRQPELIVAAKERDMWEAADLKPRRRESRPLPSPGAEAASGAA